VNKIVERIIGDRELRKAILAECAKDGEAITDQALNEWKKLRYGVPAKRVLAVARASGLKPHTIRPDIFPRGT
jgi:hypothetical protein